MTNLLWIILKMGRKKAVSLSNLTFPIYESDSSFPFSAYVLLLFTLGY